MMPTAVNCCLRSDSRLSRTSDLLDIFGNGLVAEWLRRGLQILAPRFDSGRGLQLNLLSHPAC